MWLMPRKEASVQLPLHLTSYALQLLCIELHHLIISNVIIAGEPAAAVCVDAANCAQCVRRHCELASDGRMDLSMDPAATLPMGAVAHTALLLHMRAMRRMAQLGWQDCQE